MKRIEKVVLTGGPCAGKTTALSWIKNHFEKLGWRVLIAGEAATELMSEGVFPNDFDDPLDFQKLVMETQMSKEEKYKRAAEKIRGAENFLIVCDRGLCDNKAYITKAQFEDLMAYFKMGPLDVMDRYGAVIHMVTAADGAEEFYTLENNATRKEGLEVARQLDQITQNAWVGHGHLRIIKNRKDGSFENKLREVLMEIANFLGEPEPYEIERKFLIEYPDLALLRAMPNCEEVDILQTYLLSEPGAEARVRQRSKNGSNAFTETIKKPTSDPVKRVEVERSIDQKEYLRLLMQADPKLQPIRKTRFCVMQRESGQYLEIDIYPSSQKYAVLEIELSSTEEEIVFPDFLKIVREVTDDKRFENRNLAANRGQLPED